MRLRHHFRVCACVLALAQLRTASVALDLECELEDDNDWLRYTLQGNLGVDYPNCVDQWQLDCKAPVVGTPIYSFSTPGCDPETGTCQMFADIPVVWPGRGDENPPTGTIANAIQLYSSSGALLGACGGFNILSTDLGTIRVKAGVSCSAFNATMKLRFRTCLGGGTVCEKWEDRFVDFDIASGCQRPPTFGCGEGDSAAAGACCLGPGGGVPPVGAGAPSGQGFADANLGAAQPVTPVGAAMALPLSAPRGMAMRYFFGGVGGPGLPESSAWNHSLAMFWMHDFAERIVPAPDETHVWLITKGGSFREYFNLGGSGFYDTHIPADEYRRLERLAAGSGWVLHGLDGTKWLFHENGLWDRTIDRYDKAVSGSYSAGRLTTISYPDRRTVSMTYSSVHGKLASIVETGAGGTPVRTWTYLWTSAVTNGSRLEEKLLQVTRPDGTRIALTYDTATPPHLIRVEQRPASGSTSRVEAAWEYAANGNLVRAWRGATTFGDALAWDKYSWNYPTATTVEVTDPYGLVATFTYEREEESGKPRVTGVTSPCPTCGLAPNSTIAYDNPANPGHPLRPWKITDGDNTVTEFTYDSNGQVLSRTEALGLPDFERTTEFTYDSSYPALTASIERESALPACGGTRGITRTYLSNGSLDFETRSGCRVVAGVVEPLAGEVTDFDYTGTTAGSPTEIDPPGFAVGEDVTTFDFDENRGDQVLLSRTDPLVGQTVYTYDGFNRRVTVTDVNGTVTTTAYDLLDRITSVTREGASDAQDEITRYYYTDLGDLFCIKDPELRTTAFGYDSAGRRNAIVRGTGVANPAYPGSCNDSNFRRERVFYASFDAAGRPLSEEQQFCPPGSCPSPTPWTTEARTDYVYSSACHLDQVKKATTLSPLTFAITEYEYDCNGNLSSVWDANHPSSGQASTVYKYDALNRLVETRQPWGPTAADCDPLADIDSDCAITSYGYDSQDHLTSVTDPEANTTTYVYDDRDLLTSQQSAASGLTQYEYNLHHELTMETDARGVVTNRQMDAADRVEFIDYTGTALDVDYEYGAVPDLTDFTRGRLREIVRDPAGASPIQLDFKYDRFGRGKQEGSISRTFDKNGNPKTVTYPQAVVASYDYDFMDRQTTLKVNPGTGSVNVVTAATYKANGPLATLTFASSPIRTETRAYDGRYAPVSLDVSGSLLHWNFVNDGVGNISSITPTLPVGQPVRNFGYQDFQYFLTSAAGPWSGPLAWLYDKIGNRTTETRNGVTDNYAYTTNGAAGNTPLLDLVTLGLGGTRDYTFGPAGHLELLSAGANAVDFDNDLAGQLGGVSRVSGHAAGFRFDGRGFLHEVVALTPGNGGGSGDLPFPDGFESGDICEWSTAVGWGGSQCPAGPVETRETATYDSAGRLHALVPATGGDAQFVFYFAGRPVATYTAGPMASWALLTTDHLGTPVHSLGLNGLTLWSGGFEPFGKDFTTPTAATQGIFLRLPGQWNDGLWNEAALGTELYYNVHRWFESGTGRYTSTDYLGLLASPNLFSYVDSRPTFYVDPLGLELFTPIVLPPPGCFCAVNIFLDMYRDMRRANWKHSDRYFHCKANCDATRCGNGGESCACLLSDLREWFDQATGDYRSDSAVDQGANQIGRHRSKANARTACSVNCNTFRPRNLPPKY